MCKTKLHRGGGAFLVVAAFIATTQGLAPTAFGDADGTANSNNWFFFKYSNNNSAFTTYWNAANALAATYSEDAQAWNEGGTSGLQTFGPDTKFNAGPANKTWKYMTASVPAPGTTSARGVASTAVTASQLKTYLDSFAGPGGWLPGSNTIFIGMQFAIPNSASGNPAGNPGDTSQRYFDYQSDVTAAAYDAATPEPAALALPGIGGTGLLLLRREGKKGVRAT